MTGEEIPHDGGGSASFGDLDGDGKVDLVAGKPFDGNYAHSAFYRNTGLGSVPLFGILKGNNDPFRSKLSWPLHL